MFISEVSAQLTPFQVSVFAIVGPDGLFFSPPKTIADELLAPLLAASLLAWFKLFTSVQLLPFQDSVFAVFTVGPGPVPP